MKENRVDQVPNVPNSRDVGVDEGVPLADNPDIKRIGDAKIVAMRDRHGLHSSLRQVIGYRWVCPDAQVGVSLGRRAESVYDKVVGVLVSDQHGIGAVKRVGIRKRPGIDHQRYARLTKPYARMAELPQLHSLSSVPRLVDTGDDQRQRFLR
jgi:hypothetical protein